NINLSGGYTTLAMTQVNNEIQDFANLLSASIIAGGGTATTSVTKLGNGYYVALDANFAILPVLMIGPRVEFVNAFEGKAESSGSVTIPLLGTVPETITDKYGVSLIPI